MSNLKRKTASGQIKLYCLLKRAEEMKIKWYKKQRGFTLIEVVITVAIVGILAMIAVPSMVGWKQERQMQGAARVFYSDLQHARFTAIREAEAVSFVITVPSGDYSLFIDPNQNYALDAGEKLLNSETLPAGVIFQNVTLAGNQTQFNSRGMAAETGSLDVTNTQGDMLTIYLNSLGRMSIQ